MIVTIKAYSKTTKSGKVIVLPLLEDIRNNKTFFINRGFSITVEISDNEIERLLENGILWDSSKKNPTTANNVSSTSTEPTDVGF